MLHQYLRSIKIAEAFGRIRVSLSGGLQEGAIGVFKLPG